MVSQSSLCNPQKLWGDYVDLFEKLREIPLIYIGSGGKLNRGELLPNALDTWFSKINNWRQVRLVHSVASALGTASERS
jgi:hypothetical protein